MRKKLGRLIAIFIILSWSLIPIYWTLRTSLLPHDELMNIPIKYVPTPISFENYAKLFGLGNTGNVIWSKFKEALINTCVTSGITTVIIVTISVMAGYAFSRFEFKGKKLLFSSIAATLALPIYSVIISLYKILIKFKLLDTHIGVILIYTAALVPLTVWLMKSFFNAVPIELEEAALIDGASRFQVLITILPLVVPGIIAISIITFLNCWNQFLIPLIVSTTKTKPLTVFITQFISKTSIDYGMMMSAGIISILPPALIVIFLNKYLVDGMMAGAVKN